MCALNRSIKIEIPCPKCGKKFKETLARLEDESNVSCPYCGAGVDTSGFSLDDARKGIQDFQRKIGEISRKLGKRR